MLIERKKEKKSENTNKVFHRKNSIPKPLTKKKERF